MKIIKELKYTDSHEWIHIQGNIATVGITDYAQDHLGTLVFVELPETQDEVSKGDPLAVVESVKAASDVYAPLSGTVTEINEALLDNPELLNEDPYTNWLVILEINNPEEVKELMTADDYQAFCQQGE